MAAFFNLLKNAEILEEKVETASFYAWAHGHRWFAAEDWRAMRGIPFHSDEYITKLVNKFASLEQYGNEGAREFIRYGATEYRYLWHTLKSEREGIGALLSRGIHVFTGITVYIIGPNGGNMNPNSHYAAICDIDRQESKRYRDNTVYLTRDPMDSPKNGKADVWFSPPVLPDGAVPRDDVTGGVGLPSFDILSGSYRGYIEKLRLSE
jgi:hypothetical protein